MRDGLVTVALGGDVMTGRGVDQILPRPGDPRLWEPTITDARTYVELAERANGPIERPVGPSWPWGAARRLLDDVDPDVRLINLETSITASGDAATGKAVHYRMSPDNADCVAAIHPDACALANNHVLDFGPNGLTQTLDVLSALGTRPVGAGRDSDEAALPASVPVDNGRRVWIFSLGTESSGIPATWAATSDTPGIELLPDLSPETAGTVLERVLRVKRRGDLVITSIHWGTNWGYQVPGEHVRFARLLVDGGVGVVHGHSSHHVRPVEIYRDRLILYGAGDLIDDYEGIGGHGQYRDDLRPLYFATMTQEAGALAQLRIAPLQAHRMRLRHAASEDTATLRDTFNRINDGRAPSGEIDSDGMLCLTPVATGRRSGGTGC